MALSDNEVTALTGGMDTSLHSHSFDRAMTHASLDEIQALEKFVVVTVNYTVTYLLDFVLVDSTAGVVTVTLPFSKGQKEITVVRIAGANNVVIAAAATDTVNGAATATIVASYTPRHLKAFKGYGWVQI